MTTILFFARTAAISISNLTDIFDYRYNACAKRIQERDICEWFRRERGQLIVGLGVDISEIDRLEKAITRHGRAFLERVFTPAEIQYCERHKSKFERYAARFAAKEAAMKALGTGWRRGVRWRDIEIKNEPGGKPVLYLYGAAGGHATRLGANRFVVSITHTGNLAFAQVILEG